MMKKIKQFLNLLRQYFKQALNSKYYLQAEPYLIVGPSLIGWLVAVYRYEKDHVLFRAGFYHMSVFIAYLLAFILLQIIGWVNPFQFQNYISYFQSALAAAYLTVTITYLTQFLKYQKENKTLPLPAKLQNLIDRLSL